LAVESGDMKKKDLKIQSLAKMGIVIAVLLAVNILTSRYFFRIDFTEEKRFTLSSASKKLAAEVDDIMYVKVYLDGDELSPAFNRLRNATREMLQEFRYASGSNLEYEIYNPLDGLDNKEKKDVLLELNEQGVQPIDLYEQTDEGSKQNIIIPGATFYYKNRTFPLNLLNSNFRMNNPETINNSIEGLEYAIANVIKTCVMPQSKKIAFTQGHGELAEIETGDVRNDLYSSYKVENFIFDTESNDTAFYLQFAPYMKEVSQDSLGIAFNEAIMQKMASYACLIIAKPRMFFTEREKYYLDQYVMQGGKLIWLIDPLLAEMDSLIQKPFFYTADYDLNLTDLLFKYGVRINPDVVQDYNGLLIPFRSDMLGNAQVIPRPWPYFPVVPANPEHPISKNLDLVWFRFPASIDTVGSKALKKSVLLSSSSRAKISNHPVEVNLNSARKEAPEGYFNRSFIPLAVLVEGNFKSYFEFASKEFFDPGERFIAESKSNKMIFIGDGDLIRNDFKRTGQISPAAYDRYTGKTFGNKEFFMNCVDYLCDDFGLIEVRNKEVKLRLIDKTKTDKTDKRNKLRFVNTVLPALLVLLFGVLNYWLRKRRYA